ncbi:MAG: hypothetical protein OEZ06_29225 [Myxococcales bacterium]|nr:hypothetical protein [Myxococcales bacterium]
MRSAKPRSQGCGCEDDASCGQGLSCICGVCSLVCDDHSSCAPLGTSASCRKSGLEACEAPPTGICDAVCSTDSDCGGGSELRCKDGLCRASAVASGTSDCAPMDARSNCDDCAVDGYAWDGAQCNIRTGCFGAQCDALYATFAECQRAYAECLQVGVCARMDDRRYLCDAAYGGDLGYVYNGASCEPVGCGSCDGPSCSSSIVADGLHACLDAYASCSEGEDGVSIDCQAPSDCALNKKPCCTCSYNLDTVVAVATTSVNNHRERACEGYEGTCGFCAPPSNPALYADCQQGRCVAMDQDAFASCQQDSDCTVAHRACCPCGAGADDLVAVSNVDAYLEAACRLVSTCPTCGGPDIPTDIVARCVDGHCSLP